MKKDWNARLEEITQTDKAIWATGRAFAGIDEAGRGPLCGPVCVAACILDPEHPVYGSRCCCMWTTARS